MMLAFSFGNPGLLWFLSLVLVPIIIYLINRQRYQRVPWAAMEFLMRAMRKNRRRLRMENLLLLIIRTLVILFFVLAMCRPVFESSALGAIAGNSSRSDLVVLDRSYSMGLKDGNRTALFDARNDAKSWIKNLGKGDRLGIFLAGGFPESQQTQPQFMTKERVARAIEQLEEVNLVYDPLDVAATLQAVAQWIEERGGGGGWKIHFYTDLQRKDWLTDQGAARPEIREALQHLEKDSLIVHTEGSRRPRNATITDVKCSSSLLAVDLPTSFQVTVANQGREPLAGLEVELWVNDELQGSQQVSVDPGETVAPSFPYVFREPGQARVRAVLRSDDLEEDNSRQRVFEVREAVNVLIVDGGYDSVEGVSESDWLRPALVSWSNAAGVRLTPYETHIIAAEKLHTTSLDNVQILILANVAGFSGADNDLIENFLDHGGGVLVFLGDRIDTGRYSQLSYRGGKGWFPFAPGTPRVYGMQDLPRDNRDELQYFHWRIVRKDHPALSYLASTPEAGIDEVPIHGFVPPASPVPESEVLMRLTDPDETPALIEKSYGKGIVMVLNSSADRTWSEFPVSPSFLVFLQESLPYLASWNDVSRNLSINEPFTLVVGSEKFSSRVLLIHPDSSGEALPLEKRDQSSFILRVRGQSKPGTYEVRFGEEAGKPAYSEWFVVNADPQEGNLTRVSPDELKDVYGAPALSFSDSNSAAAEGDKKPPRSGQMWRTLFWAVLLLLAAESIVARAFASRQVRKS